jgi:hypothetical protein
MKKLVLFVASALVALSFVGSAAADRMAPHPGGPYLTVQWLQFPAARDFRP